MSTALKKIEDLLDLSLEERLLGHQVTFRETGEIFAITGFSGGLEPKIGKVWHPMINRTIHFTILDDKWMKHFGRNDLDSVLLRIDTAPITREYLKLWMFDS